MGLFGVIGREAKGAFRSLNYDVHHSKRFRRLGVLAVAAVAGGVMAAGVLVRTPVPELIGMETDESGSGVTDGWSGYDSDTQEQDAETTDPSADGDAVPTGEATAPSGRVQPGDEAGGSETSTEAPGGTPGLTPVEPPTSPASEENDSSSAEPSEEPTTAEPSPSGTPSEQPSPTKSPSQSPTPSGTPTG